jgi:hypothetical protein
MRKLRTLASALMFAALFASAMVTFGTTVHAQGRGPGAGGGYCKVLTVAIDNATAAGFTDLAAYLQSVFDAHCG